MIAGKSPRLTWQPNLDGQKRTIEEARAIAKQAGIHIHYEVDFFEDEEGELPEDLTVQGPRVTKRAGSIVYWADLVNGSIGKVPFLIRPDVLQSDEAIVGVFGHEMYVLDAVRPLVNKGQTTIEQFLALTRHDCPGNLHEEAWEDADDLVERRRKGDEK